MIWLACALLAAPPVEIRLAHDSEAERETRDTLVRVLTRYPAAAARWRFQPAVTIAESVPAGVPSTPIIDTRFRYRPWHLLAAYFAAQIATRDRDYAAASREFGRMYPGKARVAARWLEFQALRESIGEAAAREVCGEKSSLISSVYLLIIDPAEAARIELVAKRYRLLPH